MQQETIPVENYSLKFSRLLPGSPVDPGHPEVVLVEDGQLFATLPCVQHHLCTSVTVCCKVLQSVTHCHTVLQSGAKCLHVLLDHHHLPIAVGESHNLPVCVPGVALHRTWAQLLYCGGHQVVSKLVQSCHCTSSLLCGGHHEAAGLAPAVSRREVLSTWSSLQERSDWQFLPNLVTFAQLGNFCPSILAW